MPKKNHRSKPKAKSKAGFSAAWLVRAVILAAIWGCILVGGIVGYYAYDLPDTNQIVQPERRPAVAILAEDGSVIARYGDLYGQNVALDDVPRDLISAIIAIEDRRFVDHFGIDVFGLARALVQNLLAGHVVQGGSTITQQLAKNLFLSPEKTFRRKVQEMLLALWLEHNYTKDQILTAYLNRVYLGAGTYGVDAASQIYFNKPVKNINLREAAILAGLLRAPSRYAPTNDLAASLERAKVVLGAMAEEGYITEEQRDNAISSSSAPPRKPGAGGDGRYFADWIAEQVGGLIKSTPQDLIVVTTLDFKLQRTAERHVSLILSEAQKRKVEQAALVTLAPDGAVKAMVGGADYHESQFNRATQAQRQPGSSFKPVVYLAAIEQGITPNDLFDDAPIKIGGWSPENYDNKYRGQITVRDAVADSINTVAVRVLQKIGAGRAIQMARSIGITSPMEPELSLALGTNTVTPLELTSAYATIAAGGRMITPYAIKEVRNRDGQVLYRRADANGPVMVDPLHVATLVDMMSGVISYGTGKRAAIDRPAAGKTGTTSDYRDAWFVGFTSDYTTGVWMGNDDNTPMQKITGGSLPAQLWHDYMIEAENGMPSRSLLTNLPEGRTEGAVESSSSDNSDSLGDLIMSIIGGDDKKADKKNEEYGKGKGILGTMPAD
ncbi:MAG: penicillin-binding protein 1A [Alphaproteobacteria bacterium]|nr:penicillin-binding protein 1A [Alphaproteobacteria bacterium]